MSERCAAATAGQGRTAATILEASAELCLPGAPVLLPCPFCGGEAEVGLAGRSMFAVGCYSNPCFVEPRTGYYDTPEAAAEIWNQREGGGV